jgi:hypothetical protein
MSLKGDKYETAEEISARLLNTVVVYDGKPVYITRIGPADVGEKKEIARVFFYELPLVGKAEEVRKYLSSRNFDLTPFKMGYINHQGQAIFLSRNPTRQYKQGLSNNTLVCTDIRGKRSEVMGFDHMIRSPGFMPMFEGKYPTFKEAGALLGDKENSSVAISRSFAFLIDHDLESLFMLHKGVRCGIAMKEDRALKVPPKFHFLREEMEEARIPIA